MIKWAAKVCTRNVVASNNFFDAQKNLHEKILTSQITFLDNLWPRSYLALNQWLQVFTQGLFWFDYK